MYDQHHMKPDSQIFQNYVPWQPSPYQPKNAAVSAAQPAFNTLPGRVDWNKRRNLNRIGSGPIHGFKQSNPDQKGFIPPPANRSGARGRRFHYPRQKFRVGSGGKRLTPPFAPRNTTSFLIRASKSGGIAPLVSPAPESLLPAWPSPETFNEEAAKKQWGFNGYGSMKGLIRLRPVNCGSGELSGAGRFEMVCSYSCEEHSLDKRVDEQDSQIAHLEEENLTLKQRMFLIERELGELRNRVLSLEIDGTASRSGEGVAENFLTGEDVSLNRVENNNCGGCVNNDNHV